MGIQTVVVQGEVSDDDLYGGRCESCGERLVRPPLFVVQVWGRWEGDKKHLEHWCGWCVKNDGEDPDEDPYDDW